ncbi:MAG TPA: GNAT family N-acetyltransferase [Actinophytocola sp.]|jgi:ribosomal protein S18 acetylase RimI-like enzyme|uniref:GNAT family N-acetyltransferase n=1 Tax=Actinophytocola sp. TaxID=1872138 RepID=UPI002F925F8B
MYDVRPATPADLADVIGLITRLQADPAHLIAFHGDTAQEVAEELAGLRPDWASGAVVATDRHGRLRGVLSVEADSEQHRAYLYGPYVDVPANHPAASQLWQATADALLDLAAGLPRMAGVTRLDLFGHRQNRLLADFAARHDVPAGDTTRLFTIEDAALRGLLVRAADDVPPAEDRVCVLPPDPGVRAAVAALHDRCFPHAPTPGHRLVADGAEHTVVVLLGDSGVIGYAGGYAQVEEYYVDVVGVDPRCRSLGAGRLLVRRLLAELARRAGARVRAAALIRLGNDASERMFTALGFELALELVNYTKTDYRPNLTQPQPSP